MNGEDSLLKPFAPERPPNGGPVVTKHLDYSDSVSAKPPKGKNSSLAKSSQSETTDTALGAERQALYPRAEPRGFTANIDNLGGLMRTLTIALTIVISLSGCATMEADWAAEHQRNHRVYAAQADGPSAGVIFGRALQAAGQRMQQTQFTRIRQCQSVSLGAGQSSVTCF
jgi:hypothetical protein